MVVANKIINKFLENLISFFPIFLILGPLFLNIFSIIFTIYAIVKFKLINQSKILNRNLIFIFFTFIFLLFPYDSLDFKNSLFKYLSFSRFIFMMIGIIIFLEYSQNRVFKKIYKYYIFFLILIILDVLFEFSTGSNILGYSSYYEGRIASFTNDELIIGFIFCFLALFTVYFIYKKTNILVFLITIFFLIFISFIIGERSNFLKFFSLILLFFIFYLFVIDKFDLKKFLLISATLSLIFISFFSFLKNTNQGVKLFDTFKEIIVFEDDNINLRIKEEFYQTRHFAHYITAYKIFLNYPIFGIGIDNFFLESKKKKYKISGYDSASTHPHQLYLEIISEVGLVGSLYLIFIFFYPIYLFFKNFQNEKKKMIFSNFLLHLFFIFPILPSGSFFGTVYGIPFWFNLSILIYLAKKK